MLQLRALPTRCGQKAAYVRATKPPVLLANLRNAADRLLFIQASNRQGRHQSGIGPEPDRPSRRSIAAEPITAGRAGDLRGLTGNQTRKHQPAAMSK